MRIKFDGRTITHILVTLMFVSGIIAYRGLENLNTPSVLQLDGERPPI